MSNNVVGIDVEEAASVVARWRGTGQKWEEIAAETSARAADLLLDAGPATTAALDVATGLGLAADLLDTRAEAMANVGWASLGGWSPFRRPNKPGDAEDALFEWLESGPRGSMVGELHDPSASEWAAMVAAGTMVDGNRTMRYFDIAADPGGGVIVVDFFIPDDLSLVVDGDGRGHEDPIFADLDSGDSRMVVVFDLESGRAMVQLDDTCLAGGWACNEARPIEMDGAEIVWSPSTDPGDYVLPGTPLPVDLLEIPNQVTVDSEPGRIEMDYDVLNGIIPVGSVDGTITLTSDGSGSYSVEDMDTDFYPSIGVYQYRPDERVDVLAQQDSKGILYAVPWLPEIIEVGQDIASTAADVATTVADAVADGAGAVVDVAVDVGAGAIDVAGDAIDELGDLFGGIGGGIDVGDIVREHCEANPEEPVCDDIPVDD